jgi:hypothetical protein
MLLHSLSERTLLYFPFFLYLAIPIMQLLFKAFTLILVFLSSCYGAQAQGPRFVFSDSFMTYDLHPIPSHLVQANGIKEASLYRYADKSDSMLLYSFQYDTAGYLVKKSLHGKSGMAITEDVFSYNAKHQLVGITMQSAMDKTVHLKSTFIHYGDSLVQSMHVYYTNSPIDTGYDTRRYHPQLAQYISTARQTKENESYNYVVDYFYSTDGQLLKRSSNYNQGTQIHTEYYVYKNRKDKRTITLWKDRNGKKAEVSKSEYNTQGQCTQVINYIPGSGKVVMEYRYYPNGLIQSYTESFPNQTKLSYKFHYRK